jgi:GNAT superfamily N-acetyltransferase
VALLNDATAADARAVIDVRNAAAAVLTAQFGPGHWSSMTTTAGIDPAMHLRRVLVARRGSVILATLTLQTKKPWAIDVAYFTPVGHAVYLVDMAVLPAHQHKGIGRKLLDHATSVARAWPADAIRLDAYDAPAGAGSFYAKCGYNEVGRVQYRGTPLVYYELVL